MRIPPTTCAPFSGRYTYTLTAPTAVRPG
jgi:hypothetical protein